MQSLLLALALLAQATDPPPLPEDKSESEPPPPLESIPGGNAVIDRYQNCIQKMIDTGRSDNAFMRKCLGLGKPRKRSADVPGGSTDHAEVTRVVSQGLPSLRQCYETHLSKSKALGVLPEGRIEPKFEIRIEGQVQALTFAAAGVNDLTLLECFRDRILTWRFSQSANPRSVELAFQLAIDSKKQAKVTLLPGFPKLNTQGFTTEELLTVFQKYASKVRVCYDQLLARKPQAAGVVGVDVSVDPRGRSKRVHFRQFTVEDASFQACLTSTIKLWQFPKPRSGQETIAQYPPWTFSPPQIVSRPPPSPPSATPALPAAAEKPSR